MRLKRTVLALSIVAGLVSAPITAFAAHTHSWGSPQYYGYTDELPDIYDDWDKCVTRHVYNYKQCLTCGEYSVYEVDTIEMEQWFLYMWKRLCEKLRIAALKSIENSCMY